MGRRQARQTALQVLFQVDMVKTSLEEAFQASLSLSRLPPADEEFARSLAGGVIAHRDRLDAIISQVSHDWRLERMGYVDRNIIRIGLYEMIVDGRVPSSVAINEAVELAKIFGGEDSWRFVNGILGEVARNQSKYTRQVTGRT
ncbi:MAG: transcription antitermination factor NusB [Desulfotomaculales bacterium]